jgi:hypothetical protein
MVGAAAHLLGRARDRAGADPEVALAEADAAMFLKKRVRKEA